MRTAALPATTFADRYVGLDAHRDRGPYRATRIADGAVVLLKHHLPDEFIAPLAPPLPPHRGIAAPLEVTTRGLGVFVVTEFVPGEPLTDLIARGPIEPHRAVTLVRALADALAHLHAHGVIHAGVEPAHVIARAHGAVVLLSIDTARLRVAQRGVARGAHHCRGPLSLINYDTRYLEPEGLLGAPASPRGDVYGAGVVLFELLVGRPAFPGDNYFEIMTAILRGPALALPAPLAALPALADLVARATARDPAARIATAADLRDLAATVAAGLPHARGKHPREPRPSR
jgi:serine/threonine-protein kinase